MLSTNGQRLCLVCNQSYPGGQLNCPRDGSPLIAIADTHIQVDAVHGYELGEVVGRGASGKVYRAKHEETGKEVCRFQKSMSQISKDSVTTSWGRFYRDVHRATSF